MQKFLIALVFTGAAFSADIPTEPAKPVPVAARSAGRLTSTAARNENVAVQAIDNNLAKESNVRVGTRPSVRDFGVPESNYFATEHGQAPSEALLTPSIPMRVPSWHLELFENHQNSVFNARTFFQVGAVQPSHRNQYGFRGTVDLKRIGFVTVTGFQRHIRGSVNGNVLVPLASERTPLATDPAVREIVQRFLNAYPNQLPNRTDFDPRALNTNAPQSINETDGTIRLDRGGLAASYSQNRIRTDAFELVAGQNPDTDIHATRARLNWRHAFSPSTDLLLGMGFTRVRSLLQPEPNAVGPRVRVGYVVEELGPDSHFPVDRAVNTFRYAAMASHRQSNHTFSFGGDLSRNQLNGVEANNQRGLFQFSSNFGRSALENLRMGTPTQYEVTTGDLNRGFRNWSGGLFAADNWKLRPNLNLTLGLRWSFDSTPTEIRQRDILPYGCDCNNFSPRIALAWSMPGKWVMRAGGTVSYSPIQPVTYQQIRTNPPLVRTLTVNNPDLVNPLAGANFNRVSPTFLTPDLTSPYSTQYNLTFERKLTAATVRAAYVGSRTYKLMNSFVTNRAQPIPGIPLTTATIDDRRADQRYYEIRTIANGGNAWFDAALFTLELPQHAGFQAAATYIFSKALDDGSDFTATAANRDLMSRRAQSQFDSYPDRHSLSDFDSPHAVWIDWNWQIPGGPHKLLRGWTVSGAALLKKGTPLTLFMGSDGPGFGNVDGSPSDRPSIIDPSILGMTVGDPNTSASIISRSRFDYIHPGELRGSLGRNTFRKAPIHNVNSAVWKQWTFHSAREWSAMFRAEAYNLLNTPQFDEPQRNMTSPSFGRITNTLNDGRVFQLSLRLML